MKSIYVPIWRYRLMATGAIVLTAAMGLSVSLGRGGDPLASPRAATGAQAEKSTYVGALYCKQCHREAAGRNTDYVYLTEFETWSKEDKHSQAYRVLTEERSQQMGKILGWEVEKDARCLNCHATNVPTSVRSNDFDIRDGVSCDACHGPASLWIVPHSDPKWRITAVAEKQKLGMRNVRDPIEQSRLCASCHVGSVAEGKVVTHDMYAAGHPPLPSFEIGAFCKYMPPHWRYLNEKPTALQQKLRAAFKIPAEEREQTKRTVIGAVVAFQAAMELLGEPRPEALTKDGSSASPDFANYDCYACHHELKTPSWRQKRGYAGRPGRLPMLAWPTVLLEDALRFAGDSALTKEYDELLSKLNQAFDAQPFGDPKQLADRANQLRRWSDRLLQRLQAERYNVAASRRLVRGLCAVKDAEKYDYSSARQKAWAIEVVLKEMGAADRAAKGLAELRQYLKLDLPSGTKRQILPELSDNLRTLNNYEPQEFKSALEKLRPLLPHE